MSAPPATRSRDEIHLATGLRVPLRDQIAAQLAERLRREALGPGDRLPSARSLSRRLDVDRGTVRAAYRRLAGRGLVTIRPGSGVRVAEPSDEPFRAFLAAERDDGRTFAEVGRLMERWRRAVSDRRVVVTGPDAGLRALWADELGAALEPADVRVEHLSPETAREEPRRLERSVVVGPAGLLSDLDGHLPRWTATLPLRPGPAPRLRRLLLQLPGGAVVALVTRTDALARQIDELAAGLRAGEVAVAVADPGSGERLDRALRVARFVLADVPCRPLLRERIDGRRLLTIRHLDPEAGRELARCFEPAAGNGDGGGRADRG